MLGSRHPRAHPAWGGGPLPPLLGVPGPLRARPRQLRRPLEFSALLTADLRPLPLTGSVPGVAGRRHSQPEPRPEVAHLHRPRAAQRPRPGEGPEDAQSRGALQVSTPAQSGRKQARPCPSAGLRGAGSRVGGARRKRRRSVCGGRATACDGACAVGVIRALRAG